MSNPKIGFVQLHRPGRAAVIVAFVLIMVIFGMSVIAGSMHIFGVMEIAVVAVLTPFVVLCISFFSRMQLLPLGYKDSELLSKLKKLKLRWLIRKSGGKRRTWKRVELGLPRTIADISLEKKLESVPIPQSLFEPERIHTSRPGSLIGCVLGVVFSLFFAFAAISSIRVVSSSAIIPLLIAVVLLYNVIRLVLGLPIVHRSRKLPELLRRVGRGRVLSKAFVVGPGWVKCGKRVWRADRDMLLIRRTGFRLAFSELDCMFVGKDSKRRMTFSGVGDEDFKLLFGGWNVDEIRLEFIDSDLS